MNNNLWIYRELYIKKITADYFARQVIDLEKGEGKISGTFDHEPKSAEEIINDYFVKRYAMYEDRKKYLISVPVSNTHLTLPTKRIV